MSNSEWTGVRLRDVLEHAGVDVNDPESAGIEHVQFEGEARRCLSCANLSLVCVLIFQGVLLRVRSLV